MKYLNYKINALVLFVLVITSSLKSQEIAHPIIGNIKEKTVVVVPFSPILYNNHAAKDMISYSGLTYEQLKAFLRLELDKAIVNRLADSCNPVSFLQRQTIVSENEDLGFVYNQSNYFLDENPNFNPEAPRKKMRSKIASDNEYLDESNPKRYQKQKARFNKQKAQNKRAKSGDIASEVKNNSDKFLNVRFYKNKLIPELSRRHNADYFVFINQFDIMGDYTNPYKVGSMSHGMTIYVHYSIFNHKGQFLTGGVAEKEYPAGEMLPQKIAEIQFADIGKYISQKLFEIIFPKSEEDKK